MNVSRSCFNNIGSLICAFLPLLSLGQSWSGDTLTINPISYADPSPTGWNAPYRTTVDFPETGGPWGKILMVQNLKCDSTTAGDQYPCGEWDYIWNTLIEVPSGDTVEIFSLGSFVTPYGKRLKLGGTDGWQWIYDISDYAPLLKGTRNLVAGNNQELLNLKFMFIKGRPAREVLSVENVYPYGEYRYEDLATDSLLKERELVLSPTASAFRLKAVVSGHGHAGPHNCCEWDSKTHSYYLNRWETFRWNVWKDCGNNPIYPQGGTWPFDRAGWCPGTKVDEYAFEISPKVHPGDTILIDYGIENFRDNGEKDGHFRMSHQLFSFGPPNFKHDAVLLEILQPSDEDAYSRSNPACGAPRIRIMNGGMVPLRYLSIEYGMKGKCASRYEWTGDLAFLETAEIELPPLKLKNQKTTGHFAVAIKTARSIMDENPGNNNLSNIYQPPMTLPSEFKLLINTNNLGRASENSFMIVDSDGLAWYFEEQLKDSSQYDYPIKLSRGCYEFLFSDDQEDGISLHWWNRNAAPDQVGINGLVQIQSVQGDTLVSFPADFGQELKLNFMVE